MMPMHSVLFYAKPQQTGPNWGRFLPIVEGKLLQDESATTLAENVWLLNVTKSPASPGFHLRQALVLEHFLEDFLGKVLGVPCPSKLQILPILIYPIRNEIFNLRRVMEILVIGAGLSAAYWRLCHVYNRPITDVGDALVIKKITIGNAIKKGKKPLVSIRLEGPSKLTFDLGLDVEKARKLSESLLNEAEKIERNDIPKFQ